MQRFTVTTLLVVCFFVAALVAKSETQTRTVYVSAVDKKGVPVADLTAADVRVSEGGRAQTPLTVEHATVPIQVALIIDDRGLGLPEVRQGLATFVEAPRGHADIGMFSTTLPDPTIVGFTQDAQALAAGIQGLVNIKATLNGPMVGGAGIGRLTYSLARQFESQGTTRPVIVVVTIEEEACRKLQLDQPCIFSPLSAIPRPVVDAVQRSHTTFFAIAARHKTMNEHNPFIDATAEASGGRVESVLTESAITVALKRIADDLLGQYAVTYFSSLVPPQEGARLQVTINRPGISVRAPERVGVR